MDLIANKRFEFLHVFKAYIDVTLGKLRMEGLYNLMWSFFQVMQTMAGNRINFVQMYGVEHEFSGLLNVLAKKHFHFTVESWSATEVAVWTSYLGIVDTRFEEGPFFSRIPDRLLITFSATKFGLSMKYVYESVWECFPDEALKTADGSEHGTVAALKAKLIAKLLASAAHYYLRELYVMQTWRVQKPMPSGDERKAFMDGKHRKYFVACGAALFFQKDIMRFLLDTELAILYDLDQGASHYEGLRDDDRSMLSSLLGSKHVLPCFQPDFTEKLLTALKIFDVLKTGPSGIRTNEIQSVFEINARRYGTFEADNLAKLTLAGEASVDLKEDSHGQRNAVDSHQSSHQARSDFSNQSKGDVASNFGSDRPSRVGRPRSATPSHAAQVRWSPYVRRGHLPFDTGTCSCSQHGCDAGDDDSIEEESGSLVGSEHRWRVAYIQI